MERKLRWKIIFTVLLLALSVVALLPSFEKLHVSKREEKEDEATGRDSMKKERKEITFSL